MTQLNKARQGTKSDEMLYIAESESIDIDDLVNLIKAGRIVIPVNKLNRGKKRTFCGIGERLSTKVNANIGTSKDYCSLDDELRKLKTAEDAGADCVMDLSTGGDIKKIRAKIVDASSIPVGTVPIYESAIPAMNCGSDFRNLTPNDMLKIVEDHAKAGIDFITVHCGVLFDTIKEIDEKGRTAGIVSRGGTILAEWMRSNKQENPFYQYFDRILELAYEYDLTLSLGDGLRPGAIADSLDYAQVAELKVLAELTKRARDTNVQVMVEGPGHVPLNHIKKQVELQKELCDGAPFYVLGPLVTDIAPGYDHITAAIGGAFAAWYGVDMICYVTPMEHLGLPKEEHVKEGIIASRIAAHAGDIAKNIPGAFEWDRQMSICRQNLDWEGMKKYCIDPGRMETYRTTRKPGKENVCSMCGELCVYELGKKK